MSWPRRNSAHARLEGALGEKLIAEGRQVEVLQAGHHGAANASESSFIAAIQPTVAIISAGMKNSHGHPHNRTLATFEDNDVPFVLQTSAGKRRDDDPPAHEFAECPDDDSDCVETRQISVDGTFRIKVDGDKYDIVSVPDSSYYRKQPGGLPTKTVELECDLAGCALVQSP